MGETDQLAYFINAGAILFAVAILVVFVVMALMAWLEDL